MSTLDAAAAEKVKTIAKALNARPQLKIDVPIAVVPDIDRPALIAAQINAQLQGGASGRPEPQEAHRRRGHSGV